MAACVVGVALAWAPSSLAATSPTPDASPAASVPSPDPAPAAAVVKAPPSPARPRPAQTNVAPVTTTFSATPTRTPPPTPSRAPTRAAPRAIAPRVPKRLHRAAPQPRVAVLQTGRPDVMIGPATEHASTDTSGRDATLLAIAGALLLALALAGAAVAERGAHQVRP